MLLKEAVVWTYETHALSEEAVKGQMKHMLFKQRVSGHMNEMLLKEAGRGLPVSHRAVHLTLEVINVEKFAALLANVHRITICKDEIDSA